MTALAPPRGLIIAAASSGSGKTVLTLGLLRALARRGTAVTSAKVGPDYIDPAFHAAASGRSCVSLDTWAMRPATLDALINGLHGDVAVVEGVMGLFDGSPSGGPTGDGSTASLAAATGWPVVLILDVAGQAASVAAVARGFASHRRDVRVAGFILNRVGGPRHEAVLRAVLAEHLPDIPVVGCIPRDRRLILEHRHLGLVQASEHGALEGFLDAAADIVETHVDMGALMSLSVAARPLQATGGQKRPLLRPFGNRIAVATDTAFAFAYPALLEAWRVAGAEIVFFSPLADEPPDGAADAVYLPGGYPELHAGRLAGNRCFFDGLRRAAGNGAAIFGECGGYMVLGEVLIDAGGSPHVMAGLLPLETTFADRKLHLGYRTVEALVDGPFGPRGTSFRGHEFHYARIVRQGSAQALFSTADAAGEDLGTAGLARGRVAGSFIHLIDEQIPLNSMPNPIV